MGKWNVRAIVKEIVTWAVLIFILSNIMSYLRKPDLDSSRLPKIEAQLLDDSNFTVAEGKPLLIHFWATWCPTCKLEASNIETISRQYEVLTIAVNSGDDAALNAYMSDNDLTFKVLNDVEGKWAKQFKVEAFPTTFIYSSKKELKFTEVGYTTTAGVLARLKMIE